MIWECQGTKSNHMDLFMAFRTRFITQIVTFIAVDFLIYVFMRMSSEVRNFPATMVSLCVRVLEPDLTCDLIGSILHTQVGNNSCEK